MIVPFTDLKAQYTSIKPEIDRALLSVFEGGQFIGGPFVARFEEDFGSLHRAQNCVAVGNGTDAIFISLKSLGLRPGDEVIVPAFGQISASEMITLAGAKPVFCDVLPSGLIDFNQIGSKITSRTKGVIVVHLYGQAAHALRVKAICEKNNLFLVEDCAQAHLTTEEAIFAGMIGDAGTFSFYPTKNLGAYGDAGCIITQNDALAEQIRLFANHGGPHQHLVEGVNSRMDPIQAAMLSVKCRHLEEWTLKRITHAHDYLEQLKDVKEVFLPEIRENSTHTFHQFVIRTKRRAMLREFLSNCGIQTMIHYPLALPNLPAYRYLNVAPEDFREAAECQEEVLSLPIYPELNSEQVGFICATIKAFFALR